MSQEMIICHHILILKIWSEGGKQGFCLNWLHQPIAEGCVSRWKCCGGDNSWQYEGRFWLIPTSSSIYNPYLGTFPAPHRAARCLGDPPPPPPHHIDDAHHHITEIQRSLQNVYTQHQTKCFHLHYTLYEWQTKLVLTRPGRAMPPPPLWRLWD